MSYRLSSLLIVCAFTWLTSSPVLAQWGHLTGKFTFEGDIPTPTPFTHLPAECQGCGLAEEELVICPQTRGIANIVVYLRDRDPTVHPSYAATANDEVEFDAVCCRFSPHVLCLRTSQQLKILNSDKVAHSFNIQPLADRPYGALLVPERPTKHQFSREQRIPIPVACNICPWMKSYILPRDNPYFAVTREDGSFTIENLPAGELQFQFWQEKAGYLDINSDWKRGRVNIRIEDGKVTDLGEIKVPRSVFE